MQKSAIFEKQISKLKNLYLKEGRSMLDIAKNFGVSIDAVAYAMRKHKIPRRSLKDASAWSFKNKRMTYKKRCLRGVNKIKAETILAMLYWGEGFKGNENSHLSTVDFANSDPEMIRVYIKALRDVYELNENKLRVLLYCYLNQNVSSLISFWSKLTGIPKSQFTKPYVRTDLQKNARTMKYGLIHIRYSDMKLLIDIKNMIHYVCQEYAPVV